jgi:hypothetical protein
MEFPDYINAILEKAKENLDNTEYSVLIDMAESIYSDYEYYEENKIKPIFSENSENKSNILSSTISNIQTILNESNSVVLIDEYNKHKYLNKKNDKKVNINKTNDIIAITKISNDISVEDAINFIDHLTQYPMLGLINSIGKKIYDYIKKSERIYIKNETMYRYVKYNNRKKNPYTINDLLCRPFGSGNHNRFNLIGYNISYFSSDEDISKKESKIMKEDRYTKIKIQIKNDKFGFNMCDLNIPLNKVSHYNVETRTDLHTEYLLPNFIADCVKHLDYDCILYNSTLNESIKNYAIFELKNRDVDLLYRKDSFI